VSTPTSQRSAIGRLLHNETTFDFVGRTRTWLAISLVLVLVSLGSLLTRGLNLGIDFDGGAVFEVECNAGQTLSVSEARDAISPLGQNQAKVQTLESEGNNTCLRVQTETLEPEQSDEVRGALANAAQVEVTRVSAQAVGPSWGDEITRKSVRALVLFLLVITLYITLRFEFLMALPTLVALLHDIIVTVGVYSLFRIEVTPATVVAVLTILGYSIYDGIVVFDKVDENAKMVTVQHRMTYSQMVNLSLNQTLMRSLNTSITALIPIISLLVVGSLILGATTLQEFAIALFIGLASGAYSSIFLASPLLAVFKEREPKMREIRRKVENKAAGVGARGSASTATASGGTGSRVANARAAAKAAAGSPPGTAATAVATETAEPAATVESLPGTALREATNRPPKPRKKGRKR
jgi:preprotein translocase subunit SecF